MQNQIIQNILVVVVLATVTLIVHVEALAPLVNPRVSQHQQQQQLYQQQAFLSPSSLAYKNTEGDDDDYPIREKGSSSKTTSSGSPTTTAATATIATVVDSDVAKPKSRGKRKPVVTGITGFAEFCDYLEDDDRLTVVKFYAPWCKTCQKLGHNLQKAAMDMGDVIVDRKKVRGQVRFAQVEYAPSLGNLLEQLQISGVPTIQLYYQSKKLWDATGITHTKELLQQLKYWSSLSSSELVEEADRVDDGVLQAAVENSMYDYPSFLDEEW